MMRRAARAYRHLNFVFPESFSVMMQLAVSGQPTANASTAAPAAAAALRSRALSHFAASTSLPTLAQPVSAAAAAAPQRSQSARQQRVCQRCQAAGREPTLRTIRGVGPAYEALLLQQGIDSVLGLQEMLHQRFEGDTEQLLQYLKWEVGIRNSRHCRAVVDYIASQPWDASLVRGSSVKLAVEGNIGAGKSTFLSIMADQQLHLQDLVEVVPEPVDLWQNFDKLIGQPRRNLLDEFYQDPRGNAYVFQHYVLLTRMQKDRAARASPKPLHILERSIFSDRMVFVRAMHDSGFMRDLELGVYDSWLKEEIDIDQQLKPNGFIYLRAQPQTCFGRLQTRARSEEVGVSEDYLGELHDKHESWLRGGVRSLEDWQEQRRIVQTIGMLRDGPPPHGSSRLHDLPDVPRSIRDNMFMLRGQLHDNNDNQIADCLRGVPVLVLDHDQDDILHDKGARESYRDKVKDFYEYVQALQGSDLQLDLPGVLDRLGDRAYQELRQLTHSYMHQARGAHGDLAGITAFRSQAQAQASSAALPGLGAAWGQPAGGGLSESAIRQRMAEILEQLQCEELAMHTVGTPGTAGRQMQYA